MEKAHTMETRQGTTKVIVIDCPPRSEGERQIRQKMLEEAMHKMWLSVQAHRMKQANSA